MKERSGSKKKENPKKDFSLFYRIILLTISFVFLVFFILLLAGSITPYYKDSITNMTFKTYTNILYDYEIVIYPSNAEVSYVEPGQEKLGIGVVTDLWNLNFGSIPPNSSYTRYIDLTNIGEKDAKVVFKVYGNITPFVGFDYKNFILGSKENATVKIIFNSISAEVGNYTGRIDRIVKIPKYNFLYALW